MRLLVCFVVCVRVRLFGWLVGCLCVCPLVGLFVGLLVWLCVCLCLSVFVCLCADCAFVRLLICVLVRFLVWFFCALVDLLVCLLGLCVVFVFFVGVRVSCFSVARKIVCALVCGCVIGWLVVCLCGLMICLFANAIG